MKTQPKDRAKLSDEKLGDINAAGVAIVGGIPFGTIASPKPRVTGPQLHPDDPADGTAIQGFRNRGGGGSI